VEDDAVGREGEHLLLVRREGIYRCILYKEVERGEESKGRI
jgi:hypothetical protein